VLAYRPLAGTRWRGRTEEEDLALEKDLLSDEKERAEHVMLVDLGRNDVGRVRHKRYLGEGCAVLRVAHLRSAFPHKGRNGRPQHNYRQACDRGGCMVARCITRPQPALHADEVRALVTA